MAAAAARLIENRGSLGGDRGGDSVIMPRLSDSQTSSMGRISDSRFEIYKK